MIMDMRTCSIDDCDRQVKAKGWCSTHYSNNYRYGDPMESRGPARGSISLGDRFNAKVQTSGACLEWTGVRDARGYGRFGIGRRTYLAHRVQWQLLRGVIPVGMFVCHHCDNPACVRIDHLFLGSHQDNMDDQASKGRRLIGDRHPSTKLTDEMGRRLLRRYLAGERPISLLAAEVGVSRPTLSRRFQDLKAFEGRGK